MSHCPLVIAHRGASGVTGEDNTIRSFEAAIEIGADMVELDLQRTADGHVVSFHDADIDDVPLNSITLDQLRAASSLPVATFQEVVAFCEGRIGLDVEIKAPDCEETVLHALEQVAQPDRVIIKSLTQSIVAKLRDMQPRCRIGYVQPRDEGQPMTPEELDQLALELDRMGADFLSPYFGRLSDELFAHSLCENRSVIPWTVNDENDLLRIAAMPVEGIVTNWPGRLIELLER